MEGFEISDMGGHTAVTRHEPKPVHIQTGQACNVQAKAAIVPASWAVGTFHQNNPIYNQRVVSVHDAVPVHRGTSSRQVSFHIFKNEIQFYVVQLETNDCD